MEKPTFFHTCTIFRIGSSYLFYFVPFFYSFIFFAFSLTLLRFCWFIISYIPCTLCRRYLGLIHACHTKAPLKAKANWLKTQRRKIKKKKRIFFCANKPHLMWCSMFNGCSYCVVHSIYLCSPSFYPNSQISLRVPLYHTVPNQFHIKMYTSKWKRGKQERHKKMKLTRGTENEKN